MVRKNELNTSPRTVEELFGADYSTDVARYFKEKQLPDGKFKEMLDSSDLEWNAVCDSECYAHIRLCGRRAQRAAEDRAFLKDDLFRMYGFGSSKSLKYDYNKSANLWVFYIGTIVNTENELSIWIQSPNSVRAHRYVYSGLSKTNGLSLKATPRDKSAINLYIKPFEAELKELTTKYYDEFKKAFKEVERNFIEIAGRPEDLPANSFAEWPFGFYYL